MNKHLFKIRILLYVFLFISFIINMTLEVKNIDMYIIFLDIILFGSLIFLDIYEKKSNNKNIK